MVAKFANIETVLTQVPNTALFVCSSNNDTTSNTAVVTYANFFANVQVDARFSANLSIPDGTAPTDSSDFSGLKSTIWHDDDYIYISTSTSNVKRVAIGSF